MPSSDPPKSTRVGLRGTSLFEFWKWARKGNYSAPPHGAYMRGLPRFGVLAPYEGRCVIECFTAGKIVTADPPDLPGEFYRKWWREEHPALPKDSPLFLEVLSYTGLSTTILLHALPTNWVIEEEEEWEAVAHANPFQIQEMARRVRQGRVMPGSTETVDFFRSLGVRTYKDRSTPVVL